jgi:hydrogenase maturation protease
MAKTLVLGVGNLLLSDDGVGIHAIRRLLEQDCLPEDVQVVDGGTAGLYLLCYLEDVDRLVIIDCIDAKQAPGAILRMAGEDIPTYLSMKVSPHEITLPDLLASARLRDLVPREVVVWGMQPASLDVGVELSPQLAARLDTLVECVVNEVKG